MRVDNNNPNIIYKNFSDWLLNYREHTLYMFFLVGAYYIYIRTTSEIEQ